MLARRTIPTLLLSAILPVAAQAATVLVFQETTKGPNPQTVVRRLVLNDGRLRIDPVGGGELRTLLFQADTGTLWVLDDTGKTYTELHRSQAPLVADEAGKPVGGGGVPQKEGTTYAKVDSGFIVNGFRADKYEGTRGGRKVEDLWVTDPKAAAVADADLKTLRAMTTTFAGAAKGRGGRFDLGAEVPGLPVRVVRYEDGKPVLQTDVTGIRQEDLPAATFELPAGYKKQATGMTNGR